MFGWSKKEKEEERARMNALLAEYETYKASMYEPQVFQVSGNLIKILVAEISINNKGRQGLVLCSNYKLSARVVHEINQDGTLSKKAAYWSKQTWKRCNPRRYAMVKCLNGPPLVPVDIFEMNTANRPFMTFEDWRFHFGK
jgi:hypothetical protein